MDHLHHVMADLPACGDGVISLRPCDAIPCPEWQEILPVCRALCLAPCGASNGCDSAAMGPWMHVLGISQSMRAVHACTQALHTAEQRPDRECQRCLLCAPSRPTSRPTA